MTYSEKLKDPRWQKKRLEIFERDGFSCQECGRDDATLHLHHEYYISGRQPWDYPNSAYRTLCSGCHEKVKESVKPGGTLTHYADWEVLLDVCENGSAAHNLACEIHWFAERCNLTHGQALTRVGELLNEGHRQLAQTV